VVCQVHDVTMHDDTTVYTQPSYAGKELVELESVAHVYRRAGGTCRVAGGNISRAVRMSKMMCLDGTTVFELDADEWDTPCSADTRGVASSRRALPYTCHVCVFCGGHQNQPLL
jgi:hypothetical protein